MSLDEDKKENKAPSGSKKVQDFTDLVRTELPKWTEPAKKNPAELKTALTGMLTLEKKTRLAADGKSTQMVALAILQLCVELGKWQTLNDQITGLCKKRAQLQSVIQAVIQEGMKYLEKAPDAATRLELLQTLRTQAAGKMFVELERARMTKMLADTKEAEGNVAEAADILHEIQVETIGTMEAREKADFLLEQIRLCLAKKDYVRAEIVANKVNTKTLAEKEYQDLKLKFYNLMIEYHSHFDNYLDICKAYREILHTPSVQEDRKQWEQALVRTTQFLLLSPWDSEVSDALHRLKSDARVEELPEIKTALEAMASEELIPWPLPWEAVWKGDAGFSSGDVGSKRWEALHKRIVQHNIRVIGQFYSRITSRRLAGLLQLDADRTESYLSEMVSSQQLFAKIDRPAGIITFGKKQEPNDVLNAWTEDMNELLGLVEKTCHMIHMEQTMRGRGGVLGVRPEAMEVKE